ncbi:MAG: MotA/TolQ/ExbB proton channel family protein [Verrucomicrobia bacterium]|nr:MotA/TolQ/ExbB proton channel family protein [Verrucomicrobiota bacterium]
MELFILSVLVLTSVVSVTFIIERGLALRRRRVIPPNLEAALNSCHSGAEVPMLRRVCEQEPSPLSELVVVAADHLSWPKAENVEALQTRSRHVVARLERGLVVLEIVTGIAPLLGLVGTIYGLITLFGSLGEAGVNEHAEFARGIALALNATLMGLMIAIPSLAAWSYYSRRVEALALELERLCDEFLRRQYPHRKKEKVVPNAVHPA